MHCTHAFFIFIIYILNLFLNNIGAFATFGGKVQNKVIFKFMKVLRLYPQRIYNYLIAFIKFHEVDSTKHSCILILLSTCKFQIFPFDLVGEMSNIIITQRKFQHLYKGTQNSYDKGR